MPERFFPESGFVHKYMSSDIIKSATIAVAIVVMNFLLRDAFIQSEFDRLQRPHHDVEKGTEVAP